MGRWKPRRRSHSYNRSYSRHTYSYGAEKAREHIREARALTLELGGADQKVKEWLFGLRSYELTPILDTYGKEFGASAQQYAEKVIPKWRSGTVQMSGMVAGRLFKLLPLFMPPLLKYEITKDLWRHYGPSSKKTFWVAPDADIEAIITKVREHVEAVVASYRIPNNLQERFDWLSGKDVDVEQDLLNYLRTVERELVIASARQNVPVLLEHMRHDNDGHTSRAAHITGVGKHEVEILVDRNAVGVQETAPPKLVRQGISPTWWWIIVLVTLLGLLAIGNRFSTRNYYSMSPSPQKHLLASATQL